MTASYLIDAVRTPRGRGKPGKGSLWRIRHVHTAGNSSGIEDGAGAVLIAMCTGGQGIATILERMS